MVIPSASRPTSRPGNPAPSPRALRKRWLRYAGLGTFLLFLIKGVAWLSLPALLVLGNCKSATTFEVRR